jgi:phage baseplate assembly protein gpV
VSTALLFESISRIARHEVTARPVSAVGIVTNSFPNEGAPPDHAVTVKLRDSGLVLPRVPVAVGAMGFAAIPAVDDLVVVTFLEGDFHAPVVVGRLYHPDQEAPKHKSGQLVLRLPSGASEAELNCEIDSDPVGILLTLPGEVKIQVVKDKVSLEVGELKVQLEAAGGGRVTVASGGTSITLKKDGDLTIKSAGKLKLEGSEVEIAGQSKVKIQGAVVEIN